MPDDGGEKLAAQLSSLHVDVGDVKPPSPPSQQQQEQDMLRGSSELVTSATSSSSSSSTVSQHVTSLPTPRPRFELETYTRCSESHLWKLMMSFYDRKGVSSWSQGIVPHFITCNAFIGRSYARVLSGFLDDCVRGAASSNDPSKSSLRLDPEHPLYIIELGTGAGKFSFFMLKALIEMSDTLAFPVSKIVYVMTDFTESNFNFWTEHPALKPYVQSGQLDFALFDAVNDTSLTLHNSKVVLGPSGPRTVNPICVVANYLFDTLCHDIFQVQDGQLKEGLISVGSDRGSEPDPLDPEIIKCLNNLYEYKPIRPDYYSSTKDKADGVHFERILGWYEDYFKPQSSADDDAAPAAAPAVDGTSSLPSPSSSSTPPPPMPPSPHAPSPSVSSGASILFPLGALRAVRNLSHLSGGRLVVISGDKGNNNPEQFRGLADPHIAVHGSFSVMVNYHAIGAYFTSRGGFALHNPQEEASLKVSCFVLPANNSVKDDAGLAPFRLEGLERLDRERSRCFPNLCRAFKDYAEDFGPNDFFIMQKCMKEDAPSPTLKSVIALLKLGDWDPDVFYKFRDTILNQVCQAGCKVKNDLCRGVPRVWENYYLLDKEKDVAFEIGRFYYGIRAYADALKYYRSSSETVGEHHVTAHNMGLCYYSLGRPDDACRHFESSIRLNGNYDKARSWLSKVRAEEERGRSGAAAAAAAETAAAETAAAAAAETAETATTAAGDDATTDATATDTTA